MEKRDDNISIGNTVNCEGNTNKRKSISTENRYKEKCEYTSFDVESLENTCQESKCNVTQNNIVNCGIVHAGQFSNINYENYKVMKNTAQTLENPYLPSGNTKNGSIRPGKSETIIEDEDTVLDGGWGWFVVLGTTLISALICSIQSTFGILFSRPLLDMNASSTTIFWIFNFFNVLYNLMGLLMEPLVQVLGWRIVGMGATFLVSVAFIISAFATTPYFLIFSFSIIGGIGSGLSLSITHTISPHYFKKYLGVANAFPMGGVCLGGFILPPLIRYILDEYAYKGTMLILAALILNAMAGAALFQPPEWHKKQSNNKTHSSTIQNHNKSDINNATTPSETQSSRLKSENSTTVHKTEIRFSELCFQVFKKFCSNLKILQNTRAIIIAFGSGLFLNGVINFFMFVPFYLQDAGHSLETSAWLVSLSSVMNFIARMLFSMLSDLKWFNKRICYMMGLLFCTVAILGFSLTIDLTLCTILLAVFGAGFGCTFSMYSLVMVEYMGVTNLGATYGASSLMITFGFMTIGPLLGYVRDATGSFAVTFWILGAMSFTTFCLWLFMPAAVAYDSNRNKNNDH
ncbi:unnamed protein product [Meganyctiphanes norvegica]|uniref:Major facilitator superfamily (MFS) profile domain-containing protein n=1 Tax=Meganyctiphanes norvegica TaxID=48144 RepID=A0AAV2R342_MEGNR